MTSQSPRIYLYKITFEEVPYYYYGIHKEKSFGEKYLGSPKTHKWCWKYYTPNIQILEVFPYTDMGWIEANAIEKRIIKVFYNSDKWCLNENCAGVSSLKYASIGGKKSKKLKLGVHSLTFEQRSEIGKRGGTKTKENKSGIFARTKEEMIEHAKKTLTKSVCSKAGKRVYENKLGIFARTRDQMIADGKKGGSTTKKLGVGIFSLTPEQRKENSSKGGKVSGKIQYELGIGIHGLTPEQTKQNASKGGKTVSSHRWKCLETGFITNAGNLTKYQRVRNIDTTKRVRLS